MSDQTVVQRNPGPKWWLVGLLILIILIIIAAVLFATHPHVFGSSATSTPTPTARATPRPAPTATGAPSATPTAVPTNTAVPTGTPPATATPGSTATAGSGSASGVQTGKVTHPSNEVKSVQQAANRGTKSDAYYLNPVTVVQKNLVKFGFPAGQYTIVQPTHVSPAPTPYTNSTGLPQARIIARYQGKTYGVFLDQPVQQGAKGVWIIIAIWPCAGTTYCG
ncbi:MAG: hypothetical protein ACRDFS_02845 [Chloroflexota bacterium]